MDEVRTYDLFARFERQLSDALGPDDLAELATCIDDCIEAAEDLKEAKNAIADAKSADDVLSELPAVAVALSHIHWHIRQVNYLRDHLRAFDD